MSFWKRKKPDLEVGDVVRLPTGDLARVTEVIVEPFSGERKLRVDIPLPGIEPGIDTFPTDKPSIKEQDA